MIFIFLGVLTALFLLGVPAAFSLGITSVVASVIQRGIENIPFTMVAQRMMYGVNSFPLLAIPFFLLAGKIMNTGGITERIFGLARALVGHYQGGLGHVNVVASMIFSGMSGSAVADAMGLGTIEIRAMNEAGYDMEGSAAITAASSTIGPIIPPSIPIVIYGVMGSVSISTLLIAGLLPGVLMGISLMILWAYQARKKNLPREPRASLAQIVRAIRQAFLPLLAPAIIVGGIWSGVFTPTEAAAISVAYSLLLTMGIYRELDVRGLYQVLRETMHETIVVLFIVSAASLYGWLLIRSRIPIILAQEMMNISTDPLVILLLINVFLLVVGCFLESIAAITILTPILLPLVQQLGINPVHFGIVMVLNLMIGLLTPPLGMCLYSVARVANLSFDRMMRAILPYYVPLLIVLLLITLFPGLVLWLPGLML